MIVKNCNHGKWQNLGQDTDDDGNIFQRHYCKVCNMARVKVVAKIVGYKNIAQTCMRYLHTDFKKKWEYFLNNIGPHTNNYI